MKKTIWVCGVIAGIISIAWSVFGDGCLDKSASYGVHLFFGYATMVLGFSLIYVGVKNYRDYQNGGVITFGLALKISLLITIVASTVYVIIWMIDFYCFIPDFGKQYMEATRAQLVAKHVSAAEIQKQMTEMARSMEQYRKPFFLAMITYKEIVPVGIVISLIAALILKKKSNPATVNV